MVSKVPDRLPSGKLTIALIELPRFSKDAIAFLRHGEKYGEHLGEKIVV